MSEQSFSIDVVPFGLARFGFVELDDGSFLALVSSWQGSVSKDRGRTWSKPQPWVTTGGAPMSGKGNASIIRLPSGRLGIQRMVLDDPDPQPRRIAPWRRSDQVSVMAMKIHVNSR